MSTGAAARVAGVHTTTIWRAIERGELAAIRLGEHGHYRIDEAELAAWLQLIDRRRHRMRMLSKFETLEERQAHEALEHAEEVRAARVEFVRRNERWTEIAPAERLIPRGPARLGWLVDAQDDTVWTRSRGTFFASGSVSLIATNVDVTFYVDAAGEVVALERVSVIPSWSWYCERQARQGAGAKAGT